ncbi:MAG TPA: fasciclin domain-containing protein [Steroidobacteraceae bacterium]|jgi:uncharacterized surface protein with fasciclin (FAS1) repeats|nr:fasciclin domain-containing protein [Steroidobacteraceae bacterium]
MKNLALIALAALATMGIVNPAGANDRRVGDVIHSDARFSTFARAIDAAGLQDLIRSTQPVTVFAPTDAAFAKLPAGTLERLLAPENRAELAALLKRHVVSGNLDQYALKRQREIATVGGDRLAVDLVAGKLRIAEARVTGRQAVATNGTVQPIDAVLAAGPGQPD